MPLSSAHAVPALAVSLAAFDTMVVGSSNATTIKVINHRQEVQMALMVFIVVLCVLVTPAPSVQLLCIMVGFL